MAINRTVGTAILVPSAECPSTHVRSHHPCKSDRYTTAFSSGASKKAKLLDAIARRFEPWRQRHSQLSRDLRDQPYLLAPHQP